MEHKAHLTGRQRRLISTLWAVLLTSVGGGCALPNPVPEPSGDPEIMIREVAGGPFTVVGSGESGGMGWRYLMYEGPDGLVCTQLDTPQSGNANCDEVDKGSAFRLFTYGADLTQDDKQYEAIHGVVAPDVARLEVEHRDGNVQNLDLIPTSAAGVDGNFFVLIHQSDARPRAIIGYAENGSVLDRRNLDPPD